MPRSLARDSTPFPSFLSTKKKKGRVEIQLVLAGVAIASSNASICWSNGLQHNQAITEEIFNTLFSCVKTIARLARSFMG
ncbi:hypothetical protein Peur_011708 [Populus x canadensis]